MEEFARKETYDLGLDQKFTINASDTMRTPYIYGWSVSNYPFY